MSHSSTLSELLAAQIECSRSLVDILAEEHQALTGNDIDRLEQVCRTKAQAAQQLHQLGEKMAEHIPPSLKTAAVEALLGQQRDGATLIQAWRELTGLARQCSDANRVNGTLVEARETQIRKSLASLNPEGPAVYGRTGASKTNLSGRLQLRA